MKLIVNADDFGYSRGQNYGIIDCYQHGIVTATTLMNNMPGCNQAYDLAKANPGLDIGVHLTLDTGSPISSSELVPSLVDELGFFKKYPLTDESDISFNTNEVYTEWKAQIDQMIENHVYPTHLDSHHHIHMLPSLIETFLVLANEYDLAIRFHPREWSPEKITSFEEHLKKLHRVDLFSSGFYMENATANFFNTLPLETEKTVEIMCHPAYLDQAILAQSTYSFERSLELEVLQSQEVKSILAKNHVELINFKQLV